MRVYLLNINRIFNDANSTKTCTSLINHFSHVTFIDNLNVRKIDDYNILC